MCWQWQKKKSCSSALVSSQKSIDLFEFHRWVLGLCQCLGRFWAKSVEIQVFPSASSYRLISFGFSLFEVGVFNRFSIMIGSISLKSWTSSSYFLNSTGLSVTSGQISIPIRSSVHTAVNLFRVNPSPTSVCSIENQQLQETILFSFPCLYGM